MTETSASKQGEAITMGPLRKPARVAGAVLCATACGMLSAPAQASCQDLTNQTVYVGVMSSRLGAAGDVITYVNAFNGGNHHELDVGANHTIGFLPPGHLFKIAVGTATADLHKDACINSNLVATLSWYDNATCSGTEVGEDFRSTLMNTCSGTVTFWRAQRSLIFKDMGNAASFRISLDVNVPSLHREVREDGCFRVASADNLNACSD
jgi:hypothetical protein